MRRIALGVAAVLLGLAALFVAAVFAVSEGGEEIVVLTTFGPDGDAAQTRLWIVEHDGAEWLRSGVAGAGWLERLEANPRVRVERADDVRERLAVPVRDPQMRDAIHARMRERYGLADRLISWIRDPDQSVAIRLDPVPAANTR